MMVSFSNRLGRVGPGHIHLSLRGGEADEAIPWSVRTIAGDCFVGFASSQ